MEKLTKVAKSKTLLFSLILAVLGAVELNLGLMQDALGEYYGGVFIAISMITAFLRVLTVTPISEK